MTAILEWARSIKPDLTKLQQETGIPALWAAAQFCHESAGSGSRGLSDLANNAENYAGLKFAPWQTAYGCTPVILDTWEESDGDRVDTIAAFCRCPSWAVWLQVYAALLTSSTYNAALAYAADPLLYGWHVGRTWATDSQYVHKAANWMTLLWDDYADTLRPVHEPVRVTVDGQELEGYRLEDGSTVGRVRPWLELVASVGGTSVFRDRHLIVTMPRKLRHMTRKGIAPV